MRYLTDRKRAVGMGSARKGTHHCWSMKVSSVALLLLTPFFIFTIGPLLGASHEKVLADFARPFPALVTGLMLIVGFTHFRNGVQVMIEDYVHGTMQTVLIIAMICLSYAAAATGLYALARLAL